MGAVTACDLRVETVNAMVFSNTFVVSRFGRLRSRRNRNLMLPLPLVVVVVLLGALSTAASATATNNVVVEEEDTTDHKEESTLDLIKTEMSGVTLYKMKSGPINIGPVEQDFPGTLPAQFIYEAWGINVTETKGGKQLITTQNQRLLRLQKQEQESDEGDNNNNEGGECANNEEIDDAVVELSDKKFGNALLNRAKDMFIERNLLNELESFLESGVSNPYAGPRRMHWVGIDIYPNKSLALHSHPNIEFAYIVQGTMYEYRLTTEDPNVYNKKIKYIPEEVNGPGTTSTSKYIGPNLTHINVGSDNDNDADNNPFQLNLYNEGEMFINTIGDVHQSFTREEGVKLFVMWGDGNADVPLDQLPTNSDTFFNSQSAQAWT